MRVLRAVQSQNIQETKFAGLSIMQGVGSQYLHLHTREAVTCGDCVITVYIRQNDVRANTHRQGEI